MPSGGDAFRLGRLGRFWDAFRWGCFQVGMVLGEDAFGMLPGGDSLRWKAFGILSGEDAFGRISVGDAFRLGSFQVGMLLIRF